MKISKTIIWSSAMIAISTQAAILTWSVDDLLVGGIPIDYSGGSDLPTIDLYLTYQGIPGEENYTPPYGLGINFNTGIPSYYVPPTFDIPLNIVDFYTIDDGYGFFNREVDVPGLDWLGDTSADWDAMNDREFSIYAVWTPYGLQKDSFNSRWNKYTSNAAGFSNTSGTNSNGYIYAGDLEVASQYMGVPEPATIGLLGISGVFVYMTRRKKG